MAQLPCVPGEPHALGTRASSRFDDNRVAELTGGDPQGPGAGEETCFRVSDPEAGENARETCLVGGPADSGCSGPEEYAALLFHPRRQTLEHAAGLGRDQPDGIRRRDEMIEIRGGRVPRGRERHRFDARRNGQHHSRVHGGDELMAFNHGQVAEQCDEHRRTLASQRNGKIAPCEPAAAEELVNQNPHRCVQV